MVENMKAIAFERMTDEQWVEAAKASLRGLSFDNLITKTMEGVDIYPLYTKESIKQKEIHEQMCNIIRSTKFNMEWIIIQPSYKQDSKSFIKNVKAQLEDGNEAIMYDGRFPVEWKIDDLTELAQLIKSYPLYVRYVNEDDDFYQLFELIDENSRYLVNGAIMNHSKSLPDGYENVRTISINTVDIHNQGADAVTELAVSLAMAAHKIGDVQSYESFAKRVIFHFAIDTHFFMEIAKLRAFRVLWHTFSKAYSKKCIPVPLYSETSLRTYSKIDPNVNMLRAGNEAFSAILGGTDMLTVYPHTILTESTEASERLARNIQLILKEEMNIHYVSDPAGGSYYIDTLTKELVNQAWKLFLEIEAIGGYGKYVDSGKLTTRLQEQYDKQMQQIKTIDKTMVGTNKYADVTSNFDLGQPPANRTEVLRNADVTGNFDLSKGGIKIPRRFSEIYESFWSYFQKESLRVILLNFGSLQDIKSRADFVSGFLAAGGIKTEWSPSFSTVDEGMAWIQEQSFDYGIICVPPVEAEKVVAQFDTNITKNLWLDIAGNYGKEVEHHWQEYGISGCIYKGLDQIEKYAAIKNRWEEMKHGKA